jgi:DMSO/TMAO reductase YedYZ molybdopterin-dependent catalytic subunit
VFVGRQEWLELSIMADTLSQNLLSPMSRRPWLKAAIAMSASSVGFARGLLAASWDSESPIVVPGKRPLILHNDYPEDLETPLHYFSSWQTPNNVFFVRQHLPVPDVQLPSWQLAVKGRVSRPASLSLAELKQFPQHKVVATLECAGNGRANFQPKVPGIQWKAGAIGNAEWRGVRLADVLSRCGVDKGASYVEFDGADTGVAATPDFIRAISLTKAIHSGTLIALEMNGEPLPKLHGHPARLIVPGWDGACWVKWLTRVTVQDQAGEGFFMKPAYRFPRHNVVPGTAAKVEDLEMIEGMPVKSFITQPLDQSKSGFGPVALTGIAWAGEEKIARVEVSTDGGGHWHDTEIISPNMNFAWVLWKYTWKPDRPGYYTVMSRASDSAGRVQPIVPIWNPSGYLWNAVDRVSIHLEG